MAECLAVALLMSLYQVGIYKQTSGFIYCTYAPFTGNADHNIDLFSYQVSNTCMSMVRDNIVEATTDPNLMRVMESTAVNYVPEVFYKQKNEYNVDVKMAAKPTFPVEYLLVTVSTSYTFVEP